MGFYRLKPDVIQAFTFEEFQKEGVRILELEAVSKGLDSVDSLLVDGVAWSFEFNGMSVTHIHDGEYMIAEKEYRDRYFRKGEMLAHHPDGEWRVVSMDQFNKHFETV